MVQLCCRYETVLLLAAVYYCGCFWVILLCLLIPSLVIRFWIRFDRLIILHAYLPSHSGAAWVLHWGTPRSLQGDVVLVHPRQPAFSYLPDADRDYESPWQDLVKHISCQDWSLHNFLGRCCTPSIGRKPNNKKQKSINIISHCVKKRPALTVSKLQGHKMQP